MQTLKITQLISSSFIFILLLGAAPSVQAKASSWTVDFGPFAGGGKISSNEAVRHASGFNVGLSKTWKLDQRTSIAPRLEFTNSYISTRKSKADVNSISSYDNRIISAGAVINRKIRANDGWNFFLGLSAGRGTSKLDVDESTKSSFTQTHNRGIPGQYKSVELGTHFDFAGKELGVNISIAGTVYQLDQSNIVGSTTAEKRSQTGGILLTEGKLSGEEQGLATGLTQSMISMKLGLAMGL